MQLFGIFATVFAALGFFLMRCRAPLWYGLIEIIVSIAVITLVFFPVSTNNIRLIAPGPSALEMALANSVGLLAGIYILVRGLDNVDRGLPERWRPIWDKVFRGQLENVPPA